MDSEIFADYVGKLDIKFHGEGRKVALIIDNSPAHPNVDKLKAIELVFLVTQHILQKLINGPGSRQGIESFLSHKCFGMPD